MIIKRIADLDEIERAASDMCQHYCRYPLIWDEQLMNQELSESELCKNCPMSVLYKNAVVEEGPLGQNDWQE